MLIHGITILILSSVLAYLSGQGVGGGSLMMLWLMYFERMEFSQAKTLNLLLFLPASVIAAGYHKKCGQINWKKILPIMLSGIAGTLFCSFIGTKMNPSILKKGFGIVLIFAGIRELRYRDR